MRRFASQERGQIDEATLDQQLDLIACRSNVLIGRRTIPGGSECSAGRRGITPITPHACCDTFRLILARTGPHHRDPDHGQTILHEVVADDRVWGLQLATILLDAEARLNVRDDLLKSTRSGGHAVGARRDRETVSHAWRRARRSGRETVGQTTRLGGENAAT